jgi:TPR repeat protein
MWDSLTEGTYANFMRQPIRMFLSCLLGFLLAAQSIAAPASDEDLAEIWRQGDVAQMQQLAASGDVRAQQWLGLMIDNRGRYDESIQWYSRAVGNGDAKSVDRIAFFYEHGIGRPKDARAALEWHRQGAELGDFSSQVRYATALRDGGILDRDETAAFKWFAKAAAQRGYEQRGYAYLPLAEMYENGSGVRRDLIRAYAYAMAAELTVDDSDTTSLTKARTLRDRIAAQISPTERASGDRLYRTLVPAAPEPDDDLYGLLALALAAVTFVAWLRYRVFRIQARN